MIAGSAVTRRREVILDYHGVRAIMQVPSTYPHLALPIKHLGYYLEDETLSENDDRDVIFRPTGNHDRHDGKYLELWACNQRADTIQ